MNSRERLSATLNHRQPDRVCVDFGATWITGIHTSIVHQLKQRLIGPGASPARVHEPYQMLAEVDAELRAALGKPLPPEAKLGKNDTGPAKIIVPTVRTVCNQGEKLVIPVIVLDNECPKETALHFRGMGHGDWMSGPLTHVGRAVYRVELPDVQEPLEYYLTATTTTGQKLMWPATAPIINQTIVTMKEKQ